MQHLVDHQWIDEQKGDGIVAKYPYLIKFRSRSSVIRLGVLDSANCLQSEVESLELVCYQPRLFHRLFRKTCSLASECSH